MFAVSGAGEYALLMKNAISWIPAVLILCVPAMLRADQVLMQNGDRINGKVLSLTTNALVIQDANLGTIQLARANVSAIFFGAAPVSAPAPANIILNGKAAVPAAVANADLAAALRGLRQQTNLVQQVETQVLGSSSPDALYKFNDLLDGLSTGRIDMNGLRAQAQSVADQLRSYKKDMGPETAAEADIYLAILDHFLRETAPTNSAAP